MGEFGLFFGVFFFVFTAFLFEFFEFCGGLFLHVVNCADNEEEGEGDDDESDDVLKEVAIADVRGVGGAEEVRDGNLEVGEIDATSDQGNERHDEVVHDRVDD